LSAEYALILRRDSDYGGAPLCCGGGWLTAAGVLAAPGVDCPECGIRRGHARSRFALSRPGGVDDPDPSAVSDADLYVVVNPSVAHDRSFPFQKAKFRGDRLFRHARTTSCLVVRLCFRLLLHRLLVEQRISERQSQRG
jgi:hypothetical protein